MPRKTVRKVTREVVEGDAEGDELEGAPLFERATETGAAWVAVSRIEPEEGYIGRIAPTATEQEILRKFGGGTFALSLRNENGKPLRGGHRNLEVAGDPIFKSKAAEQRWRRGMGIADEGNGAAKPAAQAGPSVFELLMLLDKQAEKSRLEGREVAAQREREATAAHERQLAILKTDNERRERELADERRRLEKQLESDRERDKQFFATMLQVAKAKDGGEGAGPLANLLAGVKLAQSFGGAAEGAEDPLAALAGNLPAVMGEVRRMFRPEGGGAPPAPAAGKPALPAGAPGVARDARKDVITFSEELGRKATATVRLIAGCGLDPEKILILAFDQVMGRMHELIAEQKRRQQAAPAAAPVENGAPAVPPPAPPPPAAPPQAAPP